MADELKIPADITPNDFFVNFVPEQFNKNKDKLPEESKDLVAAIAIQLDGDGGGVWTIKLDKGDLSATEGEGEDRIVLVSQSVADWRSAISGERGFRMDQIGGGGEGGGGMPQGPPLTQDKIERLKEIDGAIKFRITDKEKGDWEIIVKFGKPDKEEPDCTISVTSEDAAAMRKGELNPQMAFMSGKIQLQGDMGFAMRIGTTFMM